MDELARLETRSAWIKSNRDEAKRIFTDATKDWPALLVEKWRKNPHGCPPFCRAVDLVAGLGLPAHDAARVTKATLPERQYLALSAGAKLTALQQKVATDVWPRLTHGSISALIGPRGTGKTLVACYLLLRYMSEADQAGKYLRTLDYYRRIKGTFVKDPKETEAAIVQQVAGLGILVLDEVHESGGTDWEGTQLTSLLDARYEALRPTLLLSNERLEVLADRLGPSIVSRLREDGDVFELAGESQREAIRSGRRGRNAKGER